ncbi:DeoR/GlpR family DNA-binding transcription regulator [Zongyangia hominis]|uniref:Lactose phosphotransferase system repressor n=1 Tax=Zongyangia hominis TaxID=2763677 RepID=A0A926EEJ4_9FIRM|nr:DeoR/GlpR family DNA-binding transcription regulator [Zongyangia hominis]MBC8570714.1 DeoR/GlpR transcriptional regulator [Zongyangia hominis]
MTDRQTQILNIISEERKVEVMRLAELMNVTQVTIRKDLDYLESKGLIRRQHGTAEIDAEDDITNRLAYHYYEKSLIAAQAVEMIHNGEVIMIESGSCCTLLAEQIAKKRKDVTIITNSVYIANYIRPATSNQVVLLGGSLLMEPMVTVGPIMCQAAVNFYVDKFYTGTDGFTPNGHFTGKDIMRVETIRVMSQQAKKTIILTESNKFSRQGTLAQFPADDVYAVYTDTKIPEDVESYLKEHKVIVNKVDTTGRGEVK